MSEKPNERIINKIKNTDCSETIKKFLLEMLHFELENIEEAHPIYSRFYDLHIEKFSKGFEGKTDEI